MAFDSFQDFDDSYYGLRENPKKTWRVSVLEENGESMTCHSGKRSRVSFEPEKTRPGFEVLCPVKKKRSKLRYKFSGFCSVSDFNFNSKFSEFSGEEEAALSLVMLSSGFSNWDVFVSDFDCSEKDSLISKAKILNRNKSELVVDSETSCVELENKSCSKPVQVVKRIKSGKTVFCDRDRELGMKLDFFGSKFGDFAPINESGKLLKGDDIYIRVTDNGIEKGNEFKTSEKPMLCGDDTEVGVKLTSFGSIFGDLVMRPLKSDDFDIGYLDTETEKTNMFRTSELTSPDDHNITELGTADGFVGMEIDEFGCIISENCENKPEIECGKEIDESGSKISGNCEKKPDINTCTEIAVFSSKVSENCENKPKCSTIIDELGPKISEYSEKLPEIKCKTCNKKFLSSQALGGHRSRKCDGKPFEMGISFEQKKNQSIVHEFERGLDESGSKVPRILKKEREIKCMTCSRKFTSWQGLGGHRSRKCDEETGKMEISYEQKKAIQAPGDHQSKKCNEKSNKLEASFELKKNESFYECPICLKVFPSGQALGGHKRAHFTGYLENKTKESAAGVAGFCFTRQFGSGFGLRPCWAKRDCGPEPVGPMVIPNQEIYQV